MKFLNCSAQRLKTTIIIQYDDEMVRVILGTIFWNYLCAAHWEVERKRRGINNGSSLYLYYFSSGLGYPYLLLSLSPLIWILIASEIGLSAGFEKAMLIPGTILILILIWLSERNSSKSLNAKSCTGALSELAEVLEIKCFTDEESLMIALTEKALSWRKNSRGISEIK